MSSVTTPLHFIDYERISDVIMYINKDVSLSFNVSLAYKRGDNTRGHFHKEYCYSSSKYIDKHNLVSIKRNFKYYLSIDIKDDFNNSIMINQCNIIALRMKLKIVYSWMTSLFKYKDNKLIISGSWNDNVLYLNQYGTIKFEPTICMYDDGTYKEGVRIFLNNEKLYFDMDIDRFMEFYYVIDIIDMYQCAITILNYLQPEFGKNISYINEDNSKGSSNGGFFNNISKK